MDFLRNFMIYTLYQIRYFFKLYGIPQFMEFFINFLKNIYNFKLFPYSKTKIQNTEFYIRYILYYIEIYLFFTKLN